MWASSAAPARTAQVPAILAFEAAPQVERACGFLLSRKRRPLPGVLAPLFSPCTIALNSGRQQTDSSLSNSQLSHMANCKLQLHRTDLAGCVHWPCSLHSAGLHCHPDPHTSSQQTCFNAPQTCKVQHYAVHATATLLTHPCSSLSGPGCGPALRRRAGWERRPGAAAAAPSTGLPAGCGPAPAAPSAPAPLRGGRGAWSGGSFRWCRVAGGGPAGALVWPPHRFHG